MKKIYIIMSSILFISISIYFYILDKDLNPAIIKYSNNKMKRLGIEILRNVGLKEVNELIKSNELYVINKNNKGEIESIDFNTALLNEALLTVAKKARKRLKEIELEQNFPEEFYLKTKNNKLKQGIIFEVPLGLLSNNVFFNSFGPKIPIRVNYLGNVSLDVKSRVTNYGVNNALVEIYIYIEVIQEVVIPFQTKEEVLSSEIPIIIQVVKGNNFSYINGLNNNSYSLPLN